MHVQSNLLHSMNHMRKNVTHVTNNKLYLETLSLSLKPCVALVIWQNIRYPSKTTLFIQEIGSNFSSTYFVLKLTILHDFLFM
jgi:hypothetical protein